MSGMTNNTVVNCNNVIKTFLEVTLSREEFYVAVTSDHIDRYVYKI